MPQTFVKDPEAVLDYEWNWAEWLGNDTISSHTITNDEGITLGSHTATTTAVTAWFSGGTAGINYSATCHIVTAAGRKDDRTITFVMQSK